MTKEIPIDKRLLLAGASLQLIALAKKSEKLAEKAKEKVPFASTPLTKKIA